MTMLASIFCALFATLSSSDALVVILNSKNATSPARFAEAKEIVKKDAARGKPLQQFVASMLLEDKSLAGKYAELARHKIKRLAEEKNNSLAWYLLSLENNDLMLLKRAAEGGNVQALNAYGSILIQSAFERNIASNRLEKIVVTGYDCFRKAAAQKDPNAYINLGTCYMRGLGCDINLELAHQCFRSAAEAGHPEGMDYVSANYEHGHGVEKNRELAIVWMMKAKAVRGDKAAEEWLKK